MTNYDDTQNDAASGKANPIALDNDLETWKRKFRWAQESQALAVRILTLLNHQMAGKDTVRKILGMVKEFTGFEAVAIRLRERDDFPYFATVGFPDDFVEAENYLCDRTEAGEIVRDSDGNPVLECMCGNILCGRTNPSLSFFTEGGSFWSSHTTELLATTSEADRQARTRNRCNAVGYESVALIPLRSDRETIGLLQLNDSRKDCFTLDMITFFEGIGASIGIVLARVRTEEGLRKSREELETKVAERTKKLRNTKEHIESELAERKRMEEALRESEERFRQVFEQGPLGVAILDLNYRWVSVNPKLCEMLGYTQDELTKLTFVDITHPDDIEADLDQHKKVLQGEIPVKKMEKRYIRKTGEVLWTRLTGSLVRDEQGNPTYFLAMIEDITERKRSEEALRNLLDFRQTLIDAIPNPVFYKDVEGNYIGCNEAFAALVGLPKEEVVGKSVHEVVPKEVATCGAKRIWNCLTVLMFRYLNLLCRTPMGLSMSLVNHKAPFFDPDGALAGLIGVMVDITDRLRAEEAVRQSEERYRALAENSLTGICVHQDGLLVYVNDRYAESLDYSAKNWWASRCRRS